MNLYAIIAGLVIFGGTVSGAFFYGIDIGEDRALARQTRDDQVRAVTLEAAQQGAALAISKIEVKNVVIKQQLETRVRDQVVYRECRHDADGLRDLNEAITGVRAEPAGPGLVPRADTPHR